MDRPRLIRGLRIAWSVWWGILCVLLVVLWVRSYWWYDYGGSGIANMSGLLFESANGVTVVLFLPPITESLSWQRWFLGRCRAQIPLRVTGYDEECAADGFRLRIYPRWGFRAAVPHWSLAIVSATVAAIPWIHLSKRFSLRTLLVATTLIAVVLGTVVWSMG